MLEGKYVPAMKLVSKAPVELRSNCSRPERGTQMKPPWHFEVSPMTATGLPFYVNGECILEANVQTAECPVQMVEAKHVGATDGVACGWSSGCSLRLKPVQSEGGYH